MKKLFYFTQILLLAFLLPKAVIAQQHFNKEVGMFIAGSSAITCDSDSLLRFFDNFVKTHANLDARFDEVNIMKGDGYYYLLAADNDKLIKSAYELVLVQNTFYEIKSSEGGSTTVICSGCAVGCDPTKTSDGKWVCWPTCAPATCTKTVTVIIPND